MTPPALSFQDRYTYADYAQWDDDERWELIEGVAYNMTPAPNRRHQRISMRLTIILGIGLKGSGCHPYAAPFDVRLPEAGETAEDTYTVVQPDLSVFCGKERLDDKGATGAPDWVIEILSPSTAKKDMTVKTLLYQKHGVKEYWIVDPEKEEVTVNIYNAQTGRFEIPQVYAIEQTVVSHAFPQVSVPLEEVFGE